jgi:hypothetical protein
LILQESYIVVDRLTRSIDYDRFTQAKIAREEICDDEDETDEDNE